MINEIWWFSGDKVGLECKFSFWRLSVLNSPQILPQNVSQSWRYLLLWSTTFLINGNLYIKACLRVQGSAAVYVGGKKLAEISRLQRKPCEICWFMSAAAVDYEFENKFLKICLREKWPHRTSPVAPPLHLRRYVRLCEPAAGGQVAQAAASEGGECKRSCLIRRGRQNNETAWHTFIV